MKNLPGILFMLMVWPTNPCNSPSLSVECHLIIESAPCSWLGNVIAVFFTPFPQRKRLHLLLPTLPLFWSKRRCRFILLKCIIFLLQYRPDDRVILWVNKVGPYNNPQETYNYYSLPFCGGSGNAAHKWGGLGEVLGGNELIDSQIEIKFQSM